MHGAADAQRQQVGTLSESVGAAVEVKVEVVQIEVGGSA
jgi:hypothetical protein